MKSHRTGNLFAIVSAVVMTASMLVGANVVSADSVWVQSYERSSQTQACAAQPGETPWQESWGTDSSWSPSWEQWANKGMGGWTCTRSITWARTSAAGSSSTVTDGLGEIGPGGGLVFLIAGGLRYEMAPRTWSGTSSDDTPRLAWCSDTTNSVATGTAVGTGSANTTAMLTNASPFVACTASAANAVRVPIGGFTDWFLPSKDELNAMCNYSRNPSAPAAPSVDCTGWPATTSSSQDVSFASGAYGFHQSDGYGYWSSSQVTATSAGGRSFLTASPFQASKGAAMFYRVRPIRTF